ncbi:hypothetical protein BJ138DRAFT_1087445 [Hygrophoropsis aurantiaca]|uniref:Uncharacterized protein n=1 Tax=Hygrophoropsis aurantiaca TaxID=72124 RepID=A0ACB8ABU9_9AGAM|nr:hypothetical protein BJ138DRAFT_1087445 [Hygrophoropsis aurantiaca]
MTHPHTPIKLLSFLFSLSLLSSLCIYTASASVLAIDYGADWTKASLMKPGAPLDVLLNTDSKRKIQSAVAWKKGDRLFAGDAAAVASRFPIDSFASLKYLQGAPFDSAATDYFASISTTDILPSPPHDATSRPMLRQSDGTQWAPEELIAMQFAYIKSLADAESQSQGAIDAILTIPPYYTHAERNAILDAAELAGLRVLALVHDGTAVAVNYAMTRTFKQTEYHVVYDVGAGGVRATVVAFDPVEGDTTGKGVQITVLGVGYDRTIGGTDLDRRLRDILVERFNARHGGARRRNDSQSRYSGGGDWYTHDIRDDKRGMAQLWKEAGRVKAILSANADATAVIDTTLPNPTNGPVEVDFRTKITRAEFEAVCADLLRSGSFVQPVWDAVKKAGVGMNDVSSVILTGGASRTPMIQTAIKEAVGGDKIALNVNADEAAVLGAALYGATISRQFKTKDIRVTDILTHDIQASYLASSANTNLATKPRTINTLIFPAGTKHGTRKTLTFKRAEDFALKLGYKGADADWEGPGGMGAFPREILEVQISGVAEALGNLTERGAIDPVIKATIALSESGLVSVKEVIAFGEIKEEEEEGESLTGRLKGLFGGGDKAEQQPEEVPEGSAPGSASASGTAPNPKKSSTKGKDAKAKDRGTIPLTISTSTSVPTGLSPMSVADKKAGRERLRAIDDKEAAKVRREEARNSLEGYLYRLRDLLEPDNNDGSETPFMKCSKPSERAALSKQVHEAMAWLHDDGEMADTAQLWGKCGVLESLEQPIVHRYKEIEAFPQALNASQMWNWSTRLFLTEARENLTRADAEDPARWTSAELDALEETLRAHEVWLNDGVERQKKTKMNEDPAISTKEMKARAKVLEQQLQKLVKRKAPKPKKTKAKAGDTKGENTSSGDKPPGHDEL